MSNTYWQTRRERDARHAKLAARPAPRKTGMVASRIVREHLLSGGERFVVRVWDVDADGRAGPSERRGPTFATLAEARRFAASH